MRSRPGNEARVGEGSCRQDPAGDALNTPGEGRFQKSAANYALAGRRSFGREDSADVRWAAEGPAGGESNGKRGCEARRKPIVVQIRSGFGPSTRLEQRTHAAELATDTVMMVPLTSCMELGALRRVFVVTVVVDGAVIARLGHGNAVIVGDQPHCRGQQESQRQGSDEETRTSHSPYYTRLR